MEWDGWISASYAKTVPNSVVDGQADCQVEYFGKPTPKDSDRPKPFAVVRSSALARRVRFPVNSKEANAMRAWLQRPKS